MNPLPSCVIDAERHDQSKRKVKNRTLLRSEECGTLNVKGLRSEDLSYIKSPRTIRKKFARRDDTATTIYSGVHLGWLVKMPFT